MGTSQNVQAPPVLLVEDDPEDVYIARRAFERGKLDRPLRVVEDGREALEYLDRTGRYAGPAQAPRPALILLDLNLPYVSGLDVLVHVRSDPGLRGIPVVVLTTSDDEDDRRACGDAGASAYVTKPAQFDALLEAVMKAVRQGLACSQLVPHGEAPAP